MEKIDIIIMGCFVIAILILFSLINGASWVENKNKYKIICNEDIDSNGVVRKRNYDIFFKKEHHIFRFLYKWEKFNASSETDPNSLIRRLNDSNITRTKKIWIPRDK